VTRGFNLGHRARARFWVPGVIAFALLYAGAYATGLPAAVRLAAAVGGATMIVGLTVWTARQERDAA